MGIIAEQWVIDQQVHLAVHRATGLRRLTGLIGRAELEPGVALGFSRCQSVHSCLMRNTLDVAFVDAAGYVLAVRSLAPWRFASYHRAARVLELRAGEASRLGIVPGAQLTTTSPQEGTE